MALTPPSGLSATAISTTRVDVAWTNEDSYQYIEIWRKVGVGAYALLDTLAGFKEFFADTSCAASTLYTYKVLGGDFEPPATSGFSNEDSATTFTNLAAPTNIVQTPFSGTVIEVIWKDNSLTETGIELEVDIGGGGYNPVAASPLAPNVEYCRVTGLAGGANNYTFQVRTVQNGAQSAWCTAGAAVQCIAVPAQVTGEALSEVQDTTMRLSWDNMANETGYKIEQSLVGGGAGFSQIIVVGADITDYLVRDLVPSTTYYFRIYAYNAAGNAAVSAEVNDATLAQYAESTFEKWVSQSNIKPIYLFEINPKITLDGFVLTAGETNTYDIDLKERGIDVESVSEDGTALTERSSIALVEANAGSFYHDYFNEKLYIHTTGSDHPGGYLIEVSFWLYFSNQKDIEFNNNFYLPYLSSDNIPDITQGIKSYYEGTFTISSGSISLANALENVSGEYYFDKRYKKYTWRNQKVRLLMGGESFSYSDFEALFTALISKVGINRRQFTIDHRDIREDLTKRKISLNTYTQSDYPDLEEDYIDRSIPICFGYKEDVVPVPIDWDNKKFKYMDLRSKDVGIVKVNDAVQTEGTDYYVDLQRSIITFDRDGTDIDEDDIIEVSFYGIVNSADEVIENGAEVFKYLMNNYATLALSDLDLDSIYKSKNEIEDEEREVSLFIYKEEAFNYLIRKLEHTSKAYSLQTASGKLGFQTKETSAPSGIRSIQNYHTFEYRQEKDLASLFYKVNVHFNENPQNQKWETRTATDTDINRKFGVENKLDIKTCFSAPSLAEDLASDILDLLNKDFFYLVIPTVLFNVMPGDLIKVNRGRFFNRCAEANNITLRVLSITKSPSQKRVSIKAEPETNVYFTDFDDSAFPHELIKHIEDANRTYTIATSELTIAVANGVEAELSSTKNNCPKAIFRGGLPECPCEAIAELNSYTVNDDTLAGLLIGTDLKGYATDAFIYFGRYKDVGGGDDGLRIFKSGAGAALYMNAITTLPVWLRIRVLCDNDLEFSYSLDGNAWIKVLLIVDYPSTGWEMDVALFVSNWGVDNAVSAPFDSFRVRRNIEPDV